MNIYTAIMKAADLLERHPSLWDYHNVNVPECDTPGCALGWIGFFMGRKAGSTITGIGGVGQGDFYSRMGGIQYTDPDWMSKPDWIHSAAVAARCLRAYAETYHAHDKPQPKGIPSSVMNIFTEKVST